MIPPRSPYSLIQEDFWPDRYKILIVCMLLNCTTRKAVEKVVPRLFHQYPDADSMAVADPVQLKAMIESLGFGNRRTTRLIEMSKAYVSGKWSHPRDLPGVGDYAAAAWDIFVLRSPPSKPPRDHALTLWWEWHHIHSKEMKERNDSQKISSR